MLKDYHVHSSFSDGNDALEEIVLAAVEKGMKEIGFSDHSYTSFDLSYCMQKDAVKKYREEVLSLKEKYGGKINILLGIEQDYFADEPPHGYDYVIGSVHYVKAENEYIPIDENAETLINAANRYFGGDIMALAREYYNLAGNVVEKTGATIIGHFDLITKFNEKNRLFDENSSAYRSAWQRAADKLLKCGIPFEINTGAIAKGYKTSPYPSKEIREYILKNGGKFILSSDSHDKSTLLFLFDKYKNEVE